MTILTSQLPSGGYGYDFSTINLSPMTYLEVTKYLEEVPSSDPLARYAFDINMLCKEDPNIIDCYIMDVDFLIFYKKLITISEDASFKVSVKCPVCGEMMKRTISMKDDIKFKKVDPKIMEGTYIKLGESNYETIVPRVRNFKSVLEIYLRFRKIEDLEMIKTIALFKDFSTRGNDIEHDVLGATHSDITLLKALKELYYDQVKDIDFYCPKCNESKSIEERRGIAVSVGSLTVDFFREIINNCPISRDKIVFKQIRQD